MVKNLISIFLLCYSMLLFSQNDSLSYYYKSSVHDTVKYRHIERLMPHEENYDLRIKWCSTLMDIAKNNDRRDLVARTNFLIGTVYYDYSKYDKAMTHYYMALPVADELDLLWLKSKLYNYMGIIASDQGNSKKAVYYFRKTYEIAVKLNDVNQQFVSANNLGVDYNNMNSPTLALYYLDISEKIIRKYKAYHLMPTLAGNKMECYLSLNDLKNAKIQLDSLYIYIEKDKKVGNHQRSANYFSGQFYSIIGNYAKACEYFKDNVKIISKDEIQELRKNYRELKKCYFELGDYKNAYSALEMYNTYSDSITNAEKVRHTSEMESEYNSFKTEKELEIQKLSNANQSLKLKRNRIAVILTSVILVLAVIGFGFVYKLFTDKRKANKILEHQNEEISAQKKEILDSINYSKRIQDGILPVSYTHLDVYKRQLLSKG